MALLELDKLSLSFGGLRAISELDLEVAENEIVSIIGPNGAGKSSVFNVISGVYLPTDGDVRLGGQSIVGYKPVEHVHKIAPRALLLIGAEKDWTIPLEHAQLLYERAQALSAHSAISQLVAMRYGAALADRRLAG